MRLERISIGGVLRFTDPVTVDLASLPAGLVAVVGENGAGKSTFVEAPIAALYRTFPSRAGRPLVDYATARDAFIEAVYTIDTRGTYRARLNLDGQRRAADAVLVHVAPDGTTTTLNDGKLSTYDDAIARVFPSRDLLLASAVAAQNRVGSFVTLDKRGRKELFAQLLGLDRFEAMAATARQAATRYEAAIDSLQFHARLLATDAGADIGAALEAERGQALDGLTAIRSGLAQLVAERADQLATRDGLRDRAEHHRRSCARIDVLAAEAKSLATRASDLEEQRRSLVMARATQGRDIEAAHQQTLADLDARIAKNEALLAKAPEVHAAVAALRDARARLTQLEAARDAVSGEPARLMLEGQAANEALKDLDRVETQLAAARRAAGRLAGVCEACTFVADARAAVASIPDLEAALAGRPAAQARVEALRADYQAAQARVVGAADAVAQQRGHIAALEPEAQLLPTLEQAAARIADLRGLRARDVQVTAERQQALQARLEAALADLDQIVVTVQQSAFRVTEERAACQADADRTADAAAGLAAAEAALAALDDRWRSLSADEARLLTIIAGLEGRLARWQAKAAQLAEVEQRVAEATDEAADWQLLAKALGRDGLPVLEIDAAGPTVSAYTNDLLGACFGPRFTVELVTQAAKADGKGTKEVFELRVLDNLRGGAARDLTDLSGGEQILVDEALKNALALFINARRSGAVETMWRDETTGPLDPENALRYVDMLRRVRHIGGVRHVLFVSHNPAAAARADVQIRLAEGRATVCRPPFEVAA